ncbi:MAG: phosphohydrolase [Alistipes sp.]|nr:phosphohydrolase [Alistipes sp.]MBQ8774355.1 phosphohydrolase [Alistipes sp.]
MLQNEPEYYEWRTSELLRRAIDIAKEAHKGQVDKAGNEYIDHPLRVMIAVHSVSEKIVGVLHDVIEDTDWTFERLEAEGFTTEIIEALKCVTKLSEDEPYDAFIERVKTNPLAVAVKIKDLADNMDIRRLNELTEKDFKRLQKYHRAYKELLSK